VYHQQQAETWEGMGRIHQYPQGVCTAQDRKELGKPTKIVGSLKFFMESKVW
jgi:hypothetical protein